jgi:hypothetical protein
VVEPTHKHTQEYDEAYGKWCEVLAKCLAE